jgi:hypothetical protein
MVLQRSLAVCRLYLRFGCVALHVQRAVRVDARWGFARYGLAAGWGLGGLGLGGGGGLDGARG